MADKTEYKWLFELVECALTTDISNDFSANVVTMGSITNADIASSIAAERTDLREETIEMVLNLADAKINEKLCMGHTVVTGSAIFKPTISGTFIGETGEVDSATNRKKISITAASALRTELEDVTLSFTGTVKDYGGARIRKVTDSDSGLTDGTITPGGTIVISGTKIKCVGSDGTSAGVVRFINIETQEITEVTKLTVNKPSEVILIVPSTLATGTYTLQIETYYSSSGSTLKSARTIEYSLDLTVETDLTESTSETTTDEEADSSASEE